ncbi:MAG: TRAP transporter small permease, partial [Pseudomonadota bacterium]
PTVQMPGAGPGILRSDDAPSPKMRRYEPGIAPLQSGSPPGMFLDRIALWLGRLTAWGFLIIALMMLWEVVARYGFNAPTFWAHEIAGVIAAVAFVFGGAFCLAEGTHMRITLLLDRMPGGLRRVAEIASLLVGAVYLGGLGWAMWIIFNRSVWKFAPDGSWMPETSGSSWNTAAPSLVKLALFIGTLLFLAILLRHLGLWLIGRAPISRRLETDD